MERLPAWSQKETLIEKCNYSIGKFKNSINQYTLLAIYLYQLNFIR